jgi:hypothetical protein
MGNLIASVVLFAKRGQASPQEIAFSILFIVILLIVCLIYNAGAKIHVAMRGGVPYCPNCGRQVTFRRDYCRACGYRFRTFWESPEKYQSVIPEIPSISIRPIEHLRPVSHWERLHQDTSDKVIWLSLLEAVRKELDERLQGSKRVEMNVGSWCVSVHRSRLQYFSEVELHFEESRHGFDVTVPNHGFKIRITCPRHVPDNQIGAPWDDLLENLCKIDRSVVVNRKSKSQPLTFVPVHGPHPALRVEILAKRGGGSPPALPASKG